MANDWRGGKHILSGDELLPYKSHVGAVCWWCGSTATTQEHKFKRTDLERIWEDPFLMHGGDGIRLSKVHSPRRSPQVRFSPNLCASCNNARSQPFDLAYTAFADYVWANLNNLHRRRFLDASLVYGDDWRVGLRDLARYVVKHVGCRLASADVAVPQAFRDFLDGGNRAANTHMCLFKNKALKRVRDDGQRAGVDSDGLYIGPGAAAFSHSRRVLTMFCSSLSLSYIGVMYRWEEAASDVDPFYVHKQARLYWRHRLPKWSEGL